MKEYDFNELLNTYGKKVFNLAFRLTGNKQDAEDVTQDTFLTVYKKLSGFRGESALYTWIYRIAVNNSLQLKRTLNKAYIESLDEKIEIFKDDIPEEVRRWQEDPEQKYLYDELVNEVQQMCYHFMTFILTDEQRVVYILWTVMEFSLDDISNILELEKSVVKARLQRAKNQLKKYFRDRCQWTEGESTCSCDSRVGFALANAPELVKRLQERSKDKESRDLVGSTLHKVVDVDELYHQLPLEDYQVDLLSDYLHGA
jgi:RNA polymerase sigma-70 factor (ECF subfamily)